MAALSRLKMKTAFVGVVGDDEEGIFSMSSLKAAGVNVEGIVVRGGASLSKLLSSLFNPKVTMKNELDERCFGGARSCLGLRMSGKILLN